MTKINKTELTRLYKEELRELEKQEEVSKQFLHSIRTRRQTVLNALETLGAQVKEEKKNKKDALTPQEKTDIIAGLTK
tara:strand:+ start:4438 stop:4671 length:234 start_codon:yes stop_codon:yes gene_type:complete